MRNLRRPLCCDCLGAPLKGDLTPSSDELGLTVTQGQKTSQLSDDSQGSHWIIRSWVPPSSWWENLVTFLTLLLKINCRGVEDKYLNKYCRGKVKFKTTLAAVSNIGLIFSKSMLNSNSQYCFVSFKPKSGIWASFRS